MIINRFNNNSIYSILFIYLPSSFHHNGHLEVSFTMPLENIRRKSNQRTDQNVTASLEVLSFPRWGYQNGAISVHNNPASNNKTSLQNKHLELFLGVKSKYYNLYFYSYLVNENK